MLNDHIKKQIFGDRLKYASGRAPNLALVTRYFPMPIISRFLGITITMYWNDHLPPHYHAKYGQYEILVESHVLEWHDDHKMS